METEKKISRPDSPKDGPTDGIMMTTDCIRTDFLENQGEGEAAFHQREKSQAHVSASVEIGIFSIRDMSTGIMLTISLTEAMEVMKLAIDASKGGSPCEEKRETPPGNVETADAE